MFEMEVWLARSFTPHMENLSSFDFDTYCKMQAPSYEPGVWTQSIDSNKDRGLWDHNEPIHVHSQKKGQQNQDQDDQPEMKRSVSFGPLFFTIGG